MTTTGEVTVIHRHPDECPGCLGHGGCWVCLSSGKLDDGIQYAPCRRCGGTGMCAELAGTVVLPEQAIASGI